MPAVLISIAAGEPWLGIRRHTASVIAHTYLVCLQCNNTDGTFLRIHEKH